MNRCRNCDAVAIRELGFIGALAPFFLKRVVGAELITRYSTNPLKRSIQNLTGIAHRLVARIHPQAVAVELQSCLNCSFVQTKFPFSDEAIGRLYEDYRSDSYNRERSHYEPTYAAVANSIGSHTEAGLDRSKRSPLGWEAKSISMKEPCWTSGVPTANSFLHFTAQNTSMRSQIYNLSRASCVLLTNLHFRSIPTFSLPTFLSMS